MRYHWVLIFLAFLFAFSLAFTQAIQRVVIIDDFEKGLRPGWEIKRFEGETDYRVVKEGDNYVLRAESTGTASGLIYKFRYSLKEYPILTWRWKVENILLKGDASKKEGDDYPARIYVIFPHWFPPLTKSINYIWANRLPKDSHVPNTYYSKAIMIAVESGPFRVGQWITERRDVYEDYRRVFGEEPPEAGAIAIMTDTDQTGEHAIAYYDDIRIERYRPEMTN